MRVLVAGAAGFLGSNLSGRLLSAGHDVTGVDDLSTGLLSATAEARRSSHFRFHRLDVAGGGLLDLMARERPDVVLHAAGSEEPGRDLDATAALAGTAARLVLLSCASVYGDVRGPVTERAGLAPVTTPAAGQVAREAVVEAAGRRGGRVVVLRLATVYGPGDRRGPVARTLAGAALPDGGTTVRDLLHVEDLAELVLQVLDGRADGRRLNVGTGVATTDRALHTAVARQLGRPDAPTYAPDPGTGSPLLDCSVARRLLGWEAAVDLESGLSRTMSTT